VLVLVSSGLSRGALSIEVNTSLVFQQNQRPTVIDRHIKQQLWYIKDKISHYIETSVMYMFGYSY